MAPVKEPQLSQLLQLFTKILHSETESLALDRRSWSRPRP